VRTRRNSGAAIFKLQNFKITKLQNVARLVQSSYETTAPVDNPPYPP
jgi:hypothetical protein